MNKKKVLVLSVVILLCVGIFYVYNNILYKDARNIQSEKATFEITPSNLVADYIANTPNADSKYLNKTIEIKGKITEVTDSTIVVDNKVFCKMNNKVNINSMNKQVTIKGRCIGYDDLFGVVKFDECSNQ